MISFFLLLSFFSVLINTEAKLFSYYYLKEQGSRFFFCDCFIVTVVNQSQGVGWLVKVLSVLLELK